MARSDNGNTIGGSSNLSAIIESLDITLTAAPKHIEHRPEVTEIWGKPITLYSVPVERLDLELPPERE